MPDRKRRRVAQLDDDPDVPIASTSTATPTNQSNRTTEIETTSIQPTGNHSVHSSSSQHSRSDFPSILRSISSSHRMQMDLDAQSNASAVSAIKKGDQLSLDKYKDVTVVSIHSDDIVVCKAIRSVDTLLYLLIFLDTLLYLLIFRT